MSTTTHDLECDILVAGGGPAGVPCALAAARNGARLILCQDRHVLGGNASSEIRMHIVGADSMDRGKALEVEAREGGIIEEIRLDCCMANPQRSASMLDLILYDKCRQEPNLQLMLNTAVTGAEVRDGQITFAYAERQSTEERFRIRAKTFIDCTGDGRLGVEAGAPYQMGREGRDDYGEDMAAPKADGLKLGSTLLYTARRHDKPMPFIPPEWVRKFTPEDLEKRLHIDPDVVDAGLEYGYWWAEWGGHLDTIKDNETIRDELLAIMLGVWNFVKNSGRFPGVEHWALEWFSFLPGKRESRRFRGLYTLTQRDVMESIPQTDAIAYGGWPVDTHPPMGVDAIDEYPCKQTPVPYLYDIPLRSCLSAGPANLMFAGRNISATHIAFASTRVMATCAAMGQGIGTAAAYAIAHDLHLHNLPNNKSALKAIQQILLRQDCYLIGLYNEDDDDLARKASISASSERYDGAAVNIISGQTRSTHGEHGAPPQRSLPSSNRWISETTLPAMLQLTWENPVNIVEVQLIFDTGMHRRLTLTQSDALANRMIWGRPQPETVRDYTIEMQQTEGGPWSMLCQCEGNYQRRRVHRLKQPVSACALRLTVHATNGSAEARICEVRVY